MSVMDGLSSFFNGIAPALIKFMTFALPIAFALGNTLKKIVEPMSAYFPADMMYIYIIIAALIIVLGGYYNLKHPYRKLMCSLSVLLQPRY